MGRKAEVVMNNGSKTPTAPQPRKVTVKDPLPILRSICLGRSCGHEENYNILKGEPEAFEKGRRTKWTSKRCKACREAADGLLRKEANEIKNMPPYRLPDGAIFHAKFTEGKTHKEGRWHVTLSVPVPDKGIVSIEGSAEGLHWLLKKLGREFRLSYGTATTLASSNQGATP